MRLALLQRDGAAVVAVRRGVDYVPLDAPVASGLSPRLGADLGVALRALEEPSQRAALAAAVAAAPAEAAVAAHLASCLPPLAAGARVLCLGLNYVDHASEAALAKPEVPVVFTRYASSLVGHAQPLELPLASSAFDYEAELVVVIGRGGRRIAPERALDHVAGYTLMNDGSVRDYQVRGGQWTLGKNFDRSGALGPEVVTADELPPGARDLALRGRRNGEIMQSANTSDMLFDVATAISYISEALALAPGDLIAMGTPAGVGHARRPPVYLGDGDVFEVEVEGLGVLCNPVRREGAVPHP